MTMKFTLTKLENEEQLNLIPNKKYTVGRKDCDILIDDDRSISRNHAVLRVKINHVTLEDCGSKYKTHINGEEIEPAMQKTLKSNDLVHFGVLNSKYRFAQYKFKTTASGLTSEQKNSLKNNLAISDGILVEKWSSDVDYLTVETILLTIKLLQCLVDEKPIVSPKFWVKYAESIKKNLPTPNVEDFEQPPVGESLLSHYEFKPNPKRRQLFKNTVFVFSSEKYIVQMEELIKSCGGECISWIKSPLTLEEIKNSRKQYLIIDTEEDTETKTLNTVIKEFSKDGKRTIPVQEIALAILVCSCEKNCNPNFNKLDEVFADQPNQLPLLNKPLASQTQSQYFSALDSQSQVKTEHFIPNTLESQNDGSVAIKIENKHLESSKRLQIEQGNRMKIKKPKLELKKEQKTIESFFVTKTATGEKRKAKDDTFNETPSKKPLKENPFELKKPSGCKLSSENPFEVTTNLKKPTTNPFSSINTSQNIITIEENPFTTTKPSTNVFLKPRAKEIRTQNTFSGISFVSKISKTGLNYTWMSKSDVQIEQHSKKDYENPEMEKFVERFIDCIVLDVLPREYMRKPGRDVTNTTIDSTLGKKNFKKFRKVSPLKPQTTIINRRDFMPVGGGDTTGINQDLLATSVDEDRSPPTINNSNNKTRYKKEFVM